MRLRNMYDLRRGLVVALLLALLQVRLSFAFNDGSLHTAGGNNVNALTEKRSIQAASCSGTAPAPGYYCYGGVWTYFNTSLVSGMTLPLSGGTTSLSGSLYMGAGSNLEISGLTSTLKVAGCALLNSLVEVTLSESDVKAIRANSNAQYLIVSSPCMDASGMTVQLESVPRECHVYSVALSKSASSGLAGVYLTFSYSSFHCNIWWIILVVYICVTPVIIAALWGIKRLTAPPKVVHRRTTRFVDDA